MKKLLSLALFLGLIFTLAACTEDNDVDLPGDTPPQDDEPLSYVPSLDYEPFDFEGQIPTFNGPSVMVLTVNQAWEDPGIHYDGDYTVTSNLELNKSGTYTLRYYDDETLLLVRTVHVVREIKEIHTVDDLKNMQPEGHYRLESDLDLEGEILRPLGSKETPFKGTFYGNNHTIYNFTLKEETERSYNTGWGLFGYAIGAYFGYVTFENVNFDIENLHGTSYIDVGVLVGNVDLSRIENIKVTGSITVDGTQNNRLFVGSIVGHAYRTTMVSLSAYTDVQGLNSTGGVVGGLYASRLYYSYHQGNVEGYEGVGGLAGIVTGRRFEDNTIKSVIHQSYHQGTVTGRLSVGGISGRNVLSDMSRLMVDSTITGLEKAGQFTGDDIRENRTNQLFITEPSQTLNENGEVVDHNDQELLFESVNTSALNEAFYQNSLQFNTHRFNLTSPLPTHP